MRAEVARKRRFRWMTHAVREATMAAELETIGFRAVERSGYGRFRLYPGMRAVVARKRALGG